MAQRNRPRRAFTIDPAVAAYLDQDVVNASRVIDQAVLDFVGVSALEKAARDADLDSSETQFGLDL